MEKNKRIILIYKYRSLILFSFSIVNTMSSITLTVTGNSSSLSTYFHPEIDLDPRFNYSCCLLDFYSYNSIPNVHEKNNKFYYSTGETPGFEIMMIPVGSYEVSEIVSILTEFFDSKKIRFCIVANVNTMKCKIESDVFIDFTRDDCIGPLLGFDKRILKKGKPHKSDRIINVQNVNSIRIDCDLTTGSFHNGKGTHTIYEFSPTVSPGYKINEQPKHLIYLPVIRRRVNTLNISIVDQNGELIDFRGEKITCRIHIKKDT